MMRLPRGDTANTLDDIERFMMRLPRGLDEDFDGTLLQSMPSNPSYRNWLECMEPQTADYALVSSSANQQKPAPVTSCWAHTGTPHKCSLIPFLPMPTFTPVPNRRLASYPCHTHQGIIWLYKAETGSNDSMRIDDEVAERNWNYMLLHCQMQIGHDPQKPA